jgi:hypothetical protein
MYLARYGTLTCQLEGITSNMSENEIAAEAREQLGVWEGIVTDSTAIGYSVTQENGNTVFVFTQKTGDKA